MSDAAPIVFIVDDDPDIRSSLSKALCLRGYEVEVFDSTNAFLERFDGSQIGCLVLDHWMPDMTGLGLQQKLSEKGYAIPIIFITGHGGVPESVQAMKNGAVDFLRKPFRTSELVERVDVALHMSETLVEIGRKSRRITERFERLTPREKEIVDRMIADPSKASSKEIGAELGISPRTVDHHRARIYEKLEITSLAELLNLEREIGYLSLVPEARGLA